MHDTGLEVCSNLLHEVFSHRKTVHNNRGLQYFSKLYIAILYFRITTPNTLVLPLPCFPPLNHYSNAYLEFVNVAQVESAVAKCKDLELDGVKVKGSLISSAGSWPRDWAGKSYNLSGGLVHHVHLLFVFVLILKWSEQIFKCL